MVLFLAFLLASACAGRTSSGTPDSVPNDASQTTPDAGSCAAPFNPSSQPSWDKACPPTYGEPTAICSDGGFVPIVRVGSCDMLRVVMYDFVTHSQLCVYEGSDARAALVGVRLEDDVPSFCDRTSDTIVAGDVPAECNPPTPCAPPLRRRLTTAT
jgi:hypothetical protein